MNKLYVLFTLLFIGILSDTYGQTDPGRGMYVNRFFRTSTNQSGTVIVDPNYSILSIQDKEDSLLKYAHDNHITYLILYDVHRVFGNATYENYLCAFIQKAKSTYCISKIGIASSCAAMFDNVAIIEASEPFNFVNANYPPSLGFVQNHYTPGDPMFYLAEATKLGLRASTFNDDCNSKIDVLVTEYEFWNTGTDNCTDETATKDQKYQSFQSMITYMDAIRDDYNTNHSHQLTVETYLGYLNQNTAYTHQNIANWIDGSYNGKRRADKILLHYYSANPTGLYSRTASGANFTGYYNTRFVDFCQNTTNSNSSVLPIYSTENTNWGAGSNYFGAWFNVNMNNNIFTAEKIWYNEWHDDANTYSPGLIGNPVYGNNIVPGAAIWFTSYYMLNHLERPVLFSSNSPVCVSPGQSGALQFQYQGPIEQGSGFKFYLISANDTTTVCGNKNMQSWPLYNGVTQTSIDLNAALNGCLLPVGDYDAHLELYYSASCAPYIVPSRRVSVVTAGKIVALTPTTACAGNPVYLQASSTAGGTTSYLWYKGNSSISGATSSTYAPTSAGTSNYSCLITSSITSCSANRTASIPVTINSYPSASISVQSSSSCGKVLKASPNSAAYLWPDGSTSQTYQAVRGGFYSVFVTSNGCKTTASYTFSNVKFDVEEFNGACPGDSNGSLKIDISQGTSPYGITWNGPSSGNDVGLSTGNYLIENLKAGTYTIIVTDGNGCTASIQTSVPLANVPFPNAHSNSPLCAGHSVNLFASGGATYSWTGPLNFTSTLSNPLIAGASSLNTGTYHVEVTNQNGCSATDSVEVVVTSNFVPVANADSVCAGSDLHLSVSQGLNYSWSGPGGFTSSLQNPVIVNADTSKTGLYTVTITNSGGCIGSTSTNALVRPSPVVSASNDGPVCQGGDIHFSAVGGTSFAWTGPSNFTWALQNPELINVALSDTGNYYVTVTDSNLCSDIAKTHLSILVSTTFFADADMDGFGGSSSQQLCAPSGIYSVTNTDDCDDTDSLIHPGASEICYNGIDENCNGMFDDSCSEFLHVKLFIEGFYEGNGTMIPVINAAMYPSLCDTVTIRLHAVTAPYQVLFSIKDAIDITGNGIFQFPLAVIGNEYFISVRHRNALETWSRNPVLFTGMVNCNFVQDSSFAFGSNMKNLGDGNFAMFSGDINHDGAINLFDLNLIELNASDFGTGYNISDLTGDNLIESTDFSLIENNIGILRLRP
jgi:hypothetical protein